MIQLVGKSQLGRLGRMYENIICLHPLGQHSPTNIRTGCKDLSRTNTLAYYENLKITPVKSFLVQAPIVAFTKLKNIILLSV
jgi:hypothetical protein